MRTDKLRWWLVGVLAAAAVVSVVANKTDSRVLGWASFALFLCGVAIYVRWRRAARVFDREAKTDETRTRPDQ